MAKDPAFLFYPGDWLGGTMGLTLEEKGAYLDLLIFQFNNGKFTKDQAKHVLSICSAYAFENVLKKFDTDGHFFWKQRLFIEMERRKRYTDSRTKNAKGLKTNKLNKTKNEKAYAKHMETETINENETKNIIEKENDLLFDYEQWTTDIIDGKDHYFEQMFMNEGIPAGDHINYWILDHRDLLNRYPKMRPPNIHAFRKSCIKHIRENYKKQPNGTAKKSNTREYLKNYYRDKFGEK